MRYVDEFRDPDSARRLTAAIHEAATRPVTLMEVCGGQTHTIMRYGIDRLLPATVELIHGPGCPVCVTPVELIDKALAIAGRPGVIFTSFGDMLRVPGSREDLFAVRARGGDVRIVYSPLDAVALAKANPNNEVVFFAVGFETTAPANAMAVWQAHAAGLGNFSILVAHVLVPPAIEAVMASPHCRVQGFLAAGHVCTIMGTAEYEALAAKHHVPIVVTGFEPLDILQGVLLAVQALRDGRAAVENQYSRLVRPEGNPSARAVVERVFEVCDRPWRGIGVIPQSGLALRSEYAAFDATRRFDVGAIAPVEDPTCIAGQVLQGLARPVQCPAFGTRCTPDHPLGAPMVSAEGACSAYYRYRGVTT